MGGASYDFATAWTRKYTSGAVGLAWVAVVCTSNRYNVCSAYTTASGTLRQLQAHEVGHNFGAGHDASGSPYIMAPAVNGSGTLIFSFQLLILIIILIAGGAWILAVQVHLQQLVFS